VREVRVGLGVDGRMVGGASGRGLEGGLGAGLGRL